MKIVFIQPSLLHYRVEFYNSLQKRLKQKITVLHAGDYLNDPSIEFEQVVIKSRSMFGFKYYNLPKSTLLSAEYIVYPLDFRIINSLSIQCDSKLNKKLIYWGIGKSDSKISTYLRKRMAKNKPVILYGFEAFVDFVDVSSEVYCSHNTLLFDNNKTEYIENKKNNVIFVGSLDKRKRLECLLVAFKMSRPFLVKNAKLIIVGSGPQREKIEKVIDLLSLNEHVILKGKITDHNVLTELYNTSFCSVSYGQCGLSALQSLAMGTPVVTTSGCITGGEKLSIINGYTGFVVSDELSSVSGAICDLFRAQVNSSAYFFNCKSYHNELYSIEHMVDAFDKVVKCENIS